MVGSQDIACQVLRLSGAKAARVDAVDRLQRHVLANKLRQRSNLPVCAVGDEVPRPPKFGCRLTQAPLPVVPVAIGARLHV